MDEAPLRQCNERSSVSKALLNNQPTDFSHIRLKLMRTTRLVNMSGFWWFLSTETGFVRDGYCLLSFSQWVDGVVVNDAP